MKVLTMPKQIIITSSLDETLNVLIVDVNDTTARIVGRHLTLNTIQTRNPDKPLDYDF